MSAAASNLSDMRSPGERPLYPALHWHAVYTYPQHERAVHDDLVSRSIEVFLPRISRKSRWKDRTVTLQSPLFPGYVFTRTHPGQRITILSAPGVIRILSYNGEMAEIEDAEIEALRLCLDQGAVLEVCPSFDPGDHVRVRSGVLAGLEGRISRCKDKRRLLIPISLIHQSVAVDVATDDLELIAPVRPPSQLAATL